MIHDQGFVLKTEIGFKLDLKTIHSLNFLQTVDMHSFTLKLRQFLRLYTSFFKTFGRNKKIYMTLVKPITDSWVVKTTMNKVELHSSLSFIRSSKLSSSLSSIKLVVVVVSESIESSSVSASNLASA